MSGTQVEQLLELMQEIADSLSGIKDALEAVAAEVNRL